MLAQEAEHAKHNTEVVEKEKEKFEMENKKRSAEIDSLTKKA